MSRAPDENAPRPTPEPIRFRIGEIAVALRCDVDEVREDFVSLYDPFRSASGTASGEVDIDIRTDERAWPRRRRFLLFGDGQAIRTVHRREELMPYIEWGINTRVIATRGDLLQLHAATLSRQGQGVIFVGRSGVGKSTLAAALLSRSWTYLSDEFALIHPASLCVQPFPKALCIKQGAFEVVRQLGLPLYERRFYIKAMKGRVAYLRPHDVSPIQPVARPTPIRCVVLPRFVAGGRPGLYPISRAEAAFALARSVLNRGAFGQRLTPILADVVRGADCFRLDAGDLPATCELIESVLSGRTAAGQAVSAA